MSITKISGSSATSLHRFSLKDISTSNCHNCNQPSCLNCNQPIGHRQHKMLNLCSTLRLFLGLYFVLSVLVSKISAIGNFELEILEISNTNSHLLNGYCCGVSLAIRRMRTTGCPPCSTAFRLCLKEYSAAEQGSSSISTGCSFGNTTTGVLGGSSFVLSDPVQGAMVLPFTFRWTKSFTLILQALDMYDPSYPESERLIEETSFSSVILPSPEWKTLDHIGRNARITYRVRVQCAATYYNNTCTTFCRPRNDQFGHYNCGPQGEKICLNGWMGDNCEKATCKPGCDPIHGKCDKPGECDCRPGWQGPLCNECVVYPGCKHGSCYGEAWKCKCDTNWGGILCDQDLNYCGTHEPCKHGGTCENTAPDRFRCTCAEGLSGERCEIIEHPCATQPCKNGGSCTLKEPRNTTPFPTYRTMRGMSSAMGKPVSRRNYPLLQYYLGTSSTSGGSNNSASSLKSIDTGSNQKVSDFTCQCGVGWAGPTCEINIDECAGGPCQHGGTCIDLIGGFRCACPAEWTGDVCQIDTNECELPAALQSSPNTSSYQQRSSSSTSSSAAIAAAMTFSSASGSSSATATSSALIAALNAASSSLAASVNGSSLTTTTMMMMMGPCVNARQCINRPGSFSCECLPGWGGPTCALNFDDCVGQCKNGATCMDLINDYHCACATGFTGRDCETDIDECANFPCRNGGECVDMIGKFNCICPLGYSGTLCEEANDHCTSSPCEVGRCLNTPGSYYCHCPPGRVGKHCEQIASIQDESHCRGENCSEHNTAECSADMCKNGGVCIPGSAEHNLLAKCRCASGWDGMFCDEPINQCRDQPCHNGGSCEAGAGWFRCNCAQGFTGPDCRNNINECSPQPCQGGSTCIDGIGGYTCVCPEGRYGLRCEILLSNSKSACSNSSTSTTTSPYSPLNRSQDILTQILSDHSNEDCNACVCENATSRCTNLWCGSVNCFRSDANSKSSNFSDVCKQHEVCVPALTENCLNGPCPLRGDCRTVEPSHRVAPPQLPAKADCWPNQANLNENCARLSILLDRGKLETGSSVESLCLVFRVLLASKLVHIPKASDEGLLIILCELKAGTNDTIEVTVSSSESNDSQLPIAIKFLSELLSSRQIRTLRQSNANITSKTKFAALTSILEVKVETAVIAEANNNNILLGILGGILIILLALAIFLGVMCRQRMRMSAANGGLHMGPSLDALQYDAEKSNNLQNEEHLRRYTNPLKGSTSSLGRINGMEMSLNPIPEIDGGCNASTSNSSLHRSQPLYPDSNLTYDLEANSKLKESQRKRSSLVLLHKTQNSDIRRSTVDALESQLKESGDSLFT